MFFLETKLVFITNELSGDQLNNGESSGHQDASSVIKRDYWSPRNKSGRLAGFLMAETTACWHKLGQQKSSSVTKKQAWSSREFAGQKIQAWPAGEFVGHQEPSLVVWIVCWSTRYKLGHQESLLVTKIQARYKLGRQESSWSSRYKLGRQECSLVTKIQAWPQVWSPSLSPMMQTKCTIRMNHQCNSPVWQSVHRIRIYIRSTSMIDSWSLTSINRTYSWLNHQPIANTFGPTATLLTDMRDQPITQ